MKRILCAFTFLLLSACARDRDANDYRRDQVEEDLAKLQAITGVYSGQLISNATKQSLGIVGLQLEADTRVNNLNEEIPVIKGALLFQGPTLVKVVFSSSPFNAETNVFKLTAKYEWANSEESFDLDLTGVPNGEAIDSKFEAFGYSELGAKIKFERVVSQQAFDEAFAEPVDSGSAPYGTIDLCYKAADSASKNYAMAIQNRGMTGEDRFLNSFIPSRRTTATVIIGSIAITLNSAFVEAKDGMISAAEIGNYSGQNYMKNLNCYPTGLRGRKRLLTCEYNSTLNGASPHRMNLIESGTSRDCPINR